MVALTKTSIQKLGQSGICLVQGLSMLFNTLETLRFIRRKSFCSVSVALQKKDWQNKRHYCVRNYGPCHDIHKGEEIDWKVKRTKKAFEKHKKAVSRIEGKKFWPKLATKCRS